MLIKRGKRGEKAIWECDICGKNFKLTNSRANEKVKKDSKGMCSKKCLKKWERIENIKNITDNFEGHSPAHKQGCGVTTDGYVWIYTKGYGHNNQMKVHRYLMEQKLGRKLKSEEIVHHIDENKLNNNIDNLQIVTRSEHNKIHGFLTKTKTNKKGGSNEKGNMSSLRKPKSFD